VDLNAEAGETLSWRMGICADFATILTQMYVRLAQTMPSVPVWSLARRASLLSGSS